MQLQEGNLSVMGQWVLAKAESECFVSEFCYVRGHGLQVG